MLEAAAVTAYEFGHSDSLKAVTLFTPQTNSHDSVLLDTATGQIIGFEADSPYFPAGGAQMVITEGGGIVSGAPVFGFECYQCGDSNTYRLGKK